jgi:hypothetical protein
MILRRTFIAAVALPITIALSPLPELSAAPFGPPGSSQSGNDLVQSVQAKKKVKKAKKKKAKRAKRKKAAKAAKSCGTFKYRKGGKCVDARNKK